MKTIKVDEMQDLIDDGYADGKRSFDKCVKEIFESFDFIKVHKAMIATEWNWYLGIDEDKNENRGIPSLGTIQRHALSLLKKAYEDQKQISTGGFTAGIDSGELYLVFSLEETSTPCFTSTGH